MRSVAKHFHPLTRCPARLNVLPVTLMHSAHAQTAWIFKVVVQWFTALVQP